MFDCYMSTLTVQQPLTRHPYLNKIRNYQLFYFLFTTFPAILLKTFPAPIGVKPGFYVVVPVNMLARIQLMTNCPLFILH